MTTMKGILLGLGVFFWLLTLVHAATTEDEGERILAKVGNEAITQADVDRMIGQVGGRRIEAARRNTLKRLIDMKVFSKEAEKVKLMNDPEVAAKIEQARKQILASYFVNKYIIGKIVITDEELKDYYDLHKREFVEPEMVRLSHILVEKESEAREISKQLKDGGSFEELAQEKSIDASAAKGGDLGWLRRMAMDPSFEKVAFSLKEGEISDVVKTRSGYHIIKLTGRKESREKSFGEVKEWLRARLWTQKSNELKDEFYKKAKVEIY